MNPFVSCFLRNTVVEWPHLLLHVGVFGSGLIRLLRPGLDDHSNSSINVVGLHRFY